MSIISEALRKTQTNLKQRDSSEKQASSPEKIEPPPVQKKKFTLLPKQKKHLTPSNHLKTSPREEYSQSKKESNIDSGTKSKWGTIILIGLVLAGLLYSTIYFARSIPFASFSVTFQSTQNPEKIAAPSNIATEKDAAEFSSLQNIQVQPPKMRLNGTMMMDNKRVALINDKIFEVGDTLEEFKVINITLEKVELLGDTDLITLRVGK